MTRVVVALLLALAALLCLGMSVTRQKPSRRYEPTVWGVVSAALLFASLAAVG